MVRQPKEDLPQNGRVKPKKYGHPITQHTSMSSHIFVDGCSRRSTIRDSFFDSTTGNMGRKNLVAPTKAGQPKWQKEKEDKRSRNTPNLPGRTEMAHDRSNKGYIDEGKHDLVQSFQDYDIDPSCDCILSDLKNTKSVEDKYDEEGKQNNQENHLLSNHRSRGSGKDLVVVTKETEEANQQETSAFNPTVGVESDDASRAASFMGIARLLKRGGGGGATKDVDREGGSDHCTNSNSSDDSSEESTKPEDDGISPTKATKSKTAATAVSPAFSSLRKSSRSDSHKAERHRHRVQFVGLEPQDNEPQDNEPQDKENSLEDDDPFLATSSATFSSNVEPMSRFQLMERIKWLQKQLEQSQISVAKEKSNRRRKKKSMLKLADEMVKRHQELSKLQEQVTEVRVMYTKKLAGRARLPTVKSISHTFLVFGSAGSVI